MSHTLLLRLAGPMQSWGTASRFTVRDTGLEPSKSGVLGLVCAALGRPREMDIDDLAALHLGVRVDREGVLQQDFHTVHDVANYAGAVLKNPVVTHRSYLADANFLVGLEGDDLDLLHEIDAALRAPVWSLFLGRKAFVPSLPIAMPESGVRGGLALREALRRQPWGSAVRAGGKRPTLLRVGLETDEPRGAARRYDQPAPGATFAQRQFLARHVATEFWPLETTANDGGVPIDDCGF